MDYKNLYLKYKFKYVNLKEQIGGRISNVGTALFFNNKIYLVKENNGEWNLPGGGIDAGETDYKASIREFYEETGGFRLDEWTNELRGPLRDLVIKELLYGRSRHTKIFLYYLDKVYDDKPNIIVKKNTETTDGQWFDINQLPDNIRFENSMKAVIKKYKEDNNILI